MSSSLYHAQRSGAVVTGAPQSYIAALTRYKNAKNNMTKALTAMDNAVNGLDGQKNISLKALYAANVITAYTSYELAINNLDKEYSAWQRDRSIAARSNAASSIANNIRSSSAERNNHHLFDQARESVRTAVRLNSSRRK